MKYTINGTSQRTANHNNARGHSLYNSYPLHHCPKKLVDHQINGGRYENESKIVHVTRAGAGHHWTHWI
jgi:hypothetical protein